MSFSAGDILKPCSRCVYQKLRETIAIIDLKDQKVKVIMNFKGRNFYRRGGCEGVGKCGRCLERIEGRIEKPCSFQVSKFKNRPGVSFFLLLYLLTLVSVLLLDPIHGFLILILSFVLLILLNMKKVKSQIDRLENR